MRTIAAIVLVAAAGLSTASAQQAKQDTAPQVPFSMDHGRAADAAAAAAAANAKAAATAPGVQSSPGQPASFSINGDNVIRAASPLTPEQQKAEEEGRAAWQARCRPAVVEDRDGMRRTSYAEPDCDLSRFNTAGQ
ncbi:hypothetical protein [Bradyrhizobium sp.]|uniref:hypothetical protein n=1 Tax=Bradyrhizobium sp. TaxID=376 RepID=UPI0025C5FDB3|nr:hypothetical protein [Bradyrhizobium sp.]